MPVPSTISDLTTSEATNSPADTETVTATTRPSDYLRAHAAIIKQLEADTQPVDADLTAIAALAKTDGNIIVGNGSTWVAESGATARTSLGLAIGTDVQAYDADTAKTDVAQTWTAAQTWSAANSFNANALVTAAALTGYGTGAGGAVTQLTSKSTGVTLNKPVGQITTNNASLAAGASAYFTLTNSFITATDLVVINASDTTNYTVSCQGTIAGGAYIRVENVSAGALGEAVVINFAVINGVAS